MSNLDQRETFRTVHRHDVADEPWPTLADREPVLRAWLAAAPPQPLPRCLAVVELAHIARHHGIVAEVEARTTPPPRRTETTTLSGKDLPHD
jgi:hypothetical protein